MMPVVRINDGTFADLRTIADWYGTKTPSETIDRVVREALEQLGMERDGDGEQPAANNEDDLLVFDKAPGLSFTKPTTAAIGGKVMSNPRWVTILLEIIAQVRAKGLQGEQLVRELGVPSKSKKYDADGFRYYPELGISIQGQSAADIWREVSRLAQKWHIPVKVDFFWRQNPKAQFPGRRGALKAG